MGYKREVKRYWRLEMRENNGVGKFKSSNVQKMKE